MRKKKAPVPVPPKPKSATFTSLANDASSRMWQTPSWKKDLVEKKKRRESLTNQSSEVSPVYVCGAYQRTGLQQNQSFSLQSFDSDSSDKSNGSAAVQQQPVPAQTQAEPEPQLPPWKLELQEKKKRRSLAAPIKGNLGELLSQLYSHVHVSRSFTAVCHLRLHV